MSCELVKKLRKTTQSGHPTHVSKADRLAAADRIEELEAMLEKLIAGVETVLEEWDRGDEAAFREAIEETRADVDEAKAMMPDDRAKRQKPNPDKPIGIWQTVELNDRGLHLTARLSSETADMLGRLK